MYKLDEIFLALARKEGLKDESITNISLKDVLNTGDLSRLVPIAISEIVREAAEPLLIANQIFTKISQKEGIYIQLPAVGALDNLEEVAPGQEYGTEEITIGGGVVIRVDIRKYGLKLQLTEEMVEQSQWDVIGQWLKAAGHLFARKKNRICFNLFERQGLTLVDNKAPASGVLGRTLTGVGITGGTPALNGTFSAEDFFDIYAAMLQEGFAPKSIIMHPMSWAMWMKDPVLRTFAWQNGSGPLFNGYDMQGVKRDDFFSGLGMSKGGPRPGENTPPDFQGKGVLPGYLNVPFTVMVSPQVPFDPVKKTTSLYFIDPENAGALVQGEEINHYQWTNPETDIHSIRLREKYGAAILNEGRGVGVVKNVKIAANRGPAFGVTNVMMDVADMKFPEDATSAISGL